MHKGKLTSTQLRGLKPTGQKLSQRFNDGQGLYFHSKLRGSDSWEFRYIKPLGSATYIVIGTYPDLSLQEARNIKDNYRRLLKEGLDPALERQRIKLEQEAERVNTLSLIFESWLESKAGQLKPKTLSDIRRKLELHVMPQLGDMRVELITAPVAIGIFKPLASLGKFETIKRSIQLLKTVMTHAVNLGVIESHNLHGINEVFQKPRVNHVPSLEVDELPELLREVAVSTMRLPMKLLFEWQLHTMTRSVEAASARWQDIDLTKKVWTIPKDTMKNGRIHKIPLTNQTLVILKRQLPYATWSEYVFPSGINRKTHIHTESLNKALSRIGFKDRTTAHGLHSLASTTLHEHGFDTHVIEAALSHTDRNRVRAAYNRASFFNERMKLMTWWSDHISRNSLADLSM
ncbi:tyrosine-type recombinase/integrase [Vibrio gallicus]|uniref:tyrosine-type recombinase/integrase n=1 Tax=Vibrio gallicus TaxID=190897 RepID=UPI0021C4144A|nr:tyrosine-type recombinase/integrase [Vibrio gallicus]